METKDLKIKLGAGYERKVNKMKVKCLKPYKGFNIEKSYEEKADGTIKKDTIIYTAYTDNGYGLFDAAKTLSELKKKIDDYVTIL